MTRPFSNSKPIVWCLLAALLFGASTPASKALLDSLGPFTLAGLLYLGAAMGVFPFVLKRRMDWKRVDKKNMLYLAGAVLFGGILGPVALLWGLTLAPASSVALWLNLETPATVILGLIFFRDQLDRYTWLAVILVMVGSLVLVSPSGFGTLQAALLVLIACVFWGLDNNLTAVIDAFLPAQTTFAKGLVAGSFNLSLGLWFEGVPSAGWLVGIALLLGALSYGASMVFYIAGAQQLGATRSQTLYATSPFWGVLLAWLALGETLGWMELLAGVLMAVAVWLMHFERHDHDHQHTAQQHTHWHRHDDGHHTHTHKGLPSWVGHSHEHNHEPIKHKHRHRPDLHHRHKHE
jgi:drug/metabolite transporter (DMT)-like permease